MADNQIIPLSQAVETIKTAILQGQYVHIQKFDSPMGVATYTTAADMPEELRKALPDMDELKRIMAKVIFDSEKNLYHIIHVN